MSDKEAPGISVVTSADESDVRDELNYSTLNKMGFVRAFSEQEQWIILVNDSWKLTRFPMNEPVRDYLAFMLDRYMAETELFQRLKSFNYIFKALGREVIDEAMLQDVADLNLLYLSLFPERSRARHEPRSYKYSMDLGEMLYDELSARTKEKDDWFSGAFQQMSSSFGTAVMVLRSIKFPMQDAVSRAGTYDFASEGVATDAMKQLLMTLKTG